MNDGSEVVTRTLSTLAIFISILTTSLEVLAEHNLVAKTFAVSNADAIALFAIKILKGGCEGYRV